MFFSCFSINIWLRTIPPLLLQPAGKKALIVLGRKVEMIRPKLDKKSF
jgi:hypothetical protein